VAVSGRNQVTDFEAVVRHSSKTISRLELTRDIAILLQTLPAVLRMRGSAVERAVRRSQNCSSVVVLRSRTHRDRPHISRDGGGHWRREDTPYESLRPFLIIRLALSFRPANSCTYRAPEGVPGDTVVVLRPHGNLGLRDGWYTK